MSSLYGCSPASETARSFGYAPLYYPDQVNHCPGCSGTSWYLGRFSAECAKCHTALPLAQSMQQSMHPIFFRSPDRRGAARYNPDRGDLAYG